VRLAIVRLTSLGDIIFCMAGLQIIKRALPECSITWFADAKFADILDHNPDLDAVVKLELKGLKRDFSWQRLAGEYRKVTQSGSFDLAIDLHGMLKSAVIARKVAAASCGFHRSVAKEPLTAFFYRRSFAPPLSLMPVYRYALLAAHSLGIELKEEQLMEKRPFLCYSPKDLEATEPYFQAGRKNLLLVPGTSLGAKNYPEEKLAGVAGRLGENVLLCHGNDQELQSAQRIAERCSNAVILPRLNLNQLKAAVSRCDLVIGGDTGPTHIAWANNVPCIALFGPTPPCTYPSGINRIVLPAGGVGRPMQEIEESVILGHAGQLLAG
jgi:heptosyltransferase-1